MKHKTNVHSKKICRFAKRKMEQMSIIEYKGVEILRKEHVVLKDVSFKVEPGELVYLIGKVGSGKSSLIKSLYGEVPLKIGDARIFDYDLLSLKRKQIP